MSNELSTNQILLTSKPTESRWLVISNLPETATEETLKECLEQHGRVQSIKINDQRFALVAFVDIRTASNVHHAENILDKQPLHTAFYNDSNLLPKVLLKTSPVTSSIVEPSSSSPSSITTVTNTLMDKTITVIHDDREKRTLRTANSPEENTRHQVVPMKHDSGSSERKRKTSSITNSNTTKMKSTRQKHEKSSSSSSSSERSPSSSKHRRHHPSKLKRQSPKLNHLQTKILKIYHFPSKMSPQSLRETLRNIFIDFKKSSHLLNIKMLDDYALLTFQKSEDVDKALLFIITKSINGIRLKAEVYHGLITENDEYDLMKRCSELDIDEYSVKATRTLYIGNLQSEISHQELRELYSVYGEIVEIEIKRQQPQHSQIFAFIQYADVKSVVKVLKSKVIHDHSIKLGFGKSQPTNVLWLDNLSSNITEPTLRSFLNRITNVPSNDILDIYIDNRNTQKSQTVQCLIYFTDLKAAQNAINSVRGKKLETKRVQVDFASRIFLNRFADIIQQTNQKKNNDQWTNQPYRRYSKVSDTNSSVTRNVTRHHSSSSLSSSSSSSSSSSNPSTINHKKLIKSDTEKHANTERIFDWLMQNHHSTVNDDEEEVSEEQISNLKITENQKTSKEISTSLKKIFQTKIIPLQSDSLVIQSDIRLKVYSSLLNQSMRSIYLPFPQFAKNLTKPSTNSIILNPKAHLKHLLNNISTKQESIEANKNNEDLLINKEIDERIRLLDQRIQISASLLSHSADLSSTISTQAMKYDPMSAPTTLHSSVLSPLISPPLSNISSTKLFERLGPSMKFKRKPIPPPLSIITTLPAPSNNDNSPIFPTPKSITPTSAIGNQYHSLPLTISPSSQKQIANNSPKPTVLKSILKQPSHLSQSISNETRKAVHIVSTNPSSESTIKRTLPIDNKTKLENQQKTNMNKQQTETKKTGNSKFIEIIKKPLKIVKKPPLATKITPSLSKNSHQLNQKPTLIRPELHKKTSSFKPIQQNKKCLLKTATLKPKPSYLLNKPLVSTVKKSEQKLLNHTNQIPKKSTNEIPKKKLKLKETTCMYDRIKKRSRNEPIQNSLLSTKDKNNDHKTPSNSIQQLKRHNIIMESSDSEEDKLMTNKKPIVFDRNIFDAEENDNKKIQRQQMVISKFKKKEFILKKKLKTKSRPSKRPSTDESDRSSKRIKLPSKINEEQTMKPEISLNNTVVEKAVSPKVETVSDNHVSHMLSSSQTPKSEAKQVISVHNKEEPTVKEDETVQLDDTVDPKSFEEIHPTLSPSIHYMQQDNFNKQQIPNELSVQILTDKSTLQSPINESFEETLNVAIHSPISNHHPSNLPIDHQAAVTDKSIPTPLSDITKSSCFSSSTTNEALNLFDSRSMTIHKHPSTPIHLFPPTLTPDSSLFTPHHQHFPYPLFAPLPDSPPLSTRTRSTSSCSSIIGNSFYNTLIHGQQHSYDKESRRESLSKFSTTSSQYLSSDSIPPFGNPSELYGYPTSTQQMLNSFATEFYRMNDMQSSDPYDIQWDGYIVLKTEQAYIKTQLVAGNSQIARITINYWNSDLHHNLRISQRMRLEEIQLDGVKKHMQMDNDHCILIAEPNGLTPDEIRLEQNHLKNGVIQYLNEKKAAGIINILLPGVLEPVYVVHIFPPCQFASEILQKRAPDAYRCVVQNKTEQIYLLFIITSTIQ